MQASTKSALRIFVIAFLILIVLLASIQFLFHKIGDANIFSDDEPEIEELFKLQSIVSTDNPYFDMFNDRRKVNVLLAGTNGGLTDTILLVSFDIDRKHVDMISVPRDTYYPREGFNSAAEKKINAAYQGDINNTAEAVSGLMMGIPIHYYAVIEFQGVENIVNAIGGVPVDIPFHMRYTDRKDKLFIDIPEGFQVLNGENAVKFLRFRQGDRGYPGYPRSDLDRQIAQQEFIKSAFRQSMGKKLPAVIKSIHKNVKSNIDLKTMLEISLKSVGMTEEDISTHILPGVSETKAPWFYYTDESEIEALIKQIYQEAGTTSATSG